ncbi:hypothetical protein QKU48_gp0596 [Fadolivirus algeromassiliense]|jgi:hypothetical protein|uniref:Chromosomal protein MC1 domain-containing protein n=1 Tax=Fadolivirus FV1/VV64 TaxID=3070911 RepID=A0A7D3UVH8_9VIRU|nr:hypothetical protein QKU48_gp0596 [Fadolivirus algeromassiliense]QKF94054.1 hypothetical protein Fadolivirus_1_596 [Fadolivirus FV1/VV64]
MSTKQANSGKKASKKETKSEQPAPVVAQAPVPAPVAQPQQGGDVKQAKKAAPSKKAAAPSKKAAAPAKKAVAKSGGAKKAAPAKKAVPAKKAAAPAKKAAAPANNVPQEEDDSRTRYFKVIVDGGEAHGRFSGSKPKQAANKALTSILKSREQSGGGVTGEIKFSIVECTRGSKHKQYNYIGKRVKLDKPMKVKIGSGSNAKEIEYKFNNRVMKDKAAVVQA